MLELRERFSERSLTSGVGKIRRVAGKMVVHTRLELESAVRLQEGLARALGWWGDGYLARDNAGEA